MQRIFDPPAGRRRGDKGAQLTPAFDLEGVVGEGLHMVVIWTAYLGGGD